MNREANVQELLDSTPEQPAYFETWMKNHMSPMYIFYRRDKTGASCICGKCGIGYHTDETPVRHTKATCQWCGNHGKWEWKKVTTTQEDIRQFALLQKVTNERVVLRTFEISQRVRQGRAVDYSLDEIERRFFDMNGMQCIKKDYAYIKGRWIREWQKGRNRNVYGGLIYLGYEDEIKKTDMKYCDVELINAVANRGVMNGYKLALILEAYVNNPAIEMYAKNNMQHLVDALVSNGGKNKLIYRKGKKLQSQLRLKDKSLIKRFIESKGDMDLLQVLQYEQKYNVRWTKEQEAFVVKYSKDIKIFLKYMTLQQLMNRIEKYKQEKDSYGERSTVYRYRDFLLMREELGYDMTNELYIYPKNLRQKHNELVVEKNLKRDNERMAKSDAKFCNIKKKYKKIDKKYHFETDEYLIRPAGSASEIIKEGCTLHHCVGRNDWYMEKHHKGESYIMFLRRKSEPDVPYYTIEISGTKIVQWYSMNDRKPDMEVIKAVLDQWVEKLKTQKKIKKTA